MITQYKVGSSAIILTMAAAGVVSPPPVPLPHFQEMAIYSAFGGVSILLPMWRQDFRGMPWAMITVLTGILAAAMIGPYVAEETQKPQLAVLAATASAIAGPIAAKTPTEALQFVFKLILNRKEK
ncbi:MAG: hypothetical protein AAGB02_03210 [Pseudomonadota bacterium]